MIPEGAVEIVTIPETWKCLLIKRCGLCDLKVTQFTSAMQKYETKGKMEFRCSEYIVLERKNFVKDITIGVPPSQIYKHMEEPNDSSDETLREEELCIGRIQAKCMPK